MGTYGAGSSKNNFDKGREPKVGDWIRFSDEIHDLAMGVVEYIDVGGGQNPSVLYTSEGSVLSDAILEVR